jgi:hypothetical protein
MNLKQSVPRTPILVLQYFEVILSMLSESCKNETIYTVLSNYIIHFVELYT